MDVLAAIRTRRSISRLSPPAPSDDELRTILEAATCAPDHGTLRPWRFVVLAGEAKEAFGSVLADATVADYHDRGLEPEPAKVEKDRTKMTRGPLVVVVACRYGPSPKIPRHEQFAAVVAATQNACLAATALGYGSMWRTGPNADNPHVKRSLGLEEADDIVGFLYLGTAEPAAAKPANTGALDGVVTDWRPPAP
ncbi:MAG: nitroreductase [Acidimicrobiales bacterium]